MVDPAGLVNNIVAKLRLIPELVAEMDGNTDAIKPYHGRFPKEASYAQALLEMDCPSVLVAWRGWMVVGSTNGGTKRQHTVEIAIRAKLEEDDDDTTASAYYALSAYILEGIPDGDDQPIIYQDIHTDFDLMDISAGQWESDAEGLDYFRVPLVFMER